MRRYRAIAVFLLGVGMTFVLGTAFADEQDTIKAECQEIRRQAQAAKAPSARARQRISLTISVTWSCIQASGGKGDYWLKKAREYRQQARAHWASAEGAISVDGAPAGGESRDSGSSGAKPPGGGSAGGGSTTSSGADERVSLKTECGALMAKFQGAKPKDAASRQKLAIVQNKSFACMQALHGKGDYWLAQARQHRDAAKAAWAAAVAAGVNDVVEEGIQKAPAFTTGECQKACEVNFKGMVGLIEQCKKKNCLQEMEGNQASANYFERYSGGMKTTLSEIKAFRDRIYGVACPTGKGLKPVADAFVTQAEKTLLGVERCKRTRSLDQLQKCMQPYATVVNGAFNAIKRLADQMEEVCKRIQAENSLPELQADYKRRLARAKESADEVVAASRNMQKCGTYDWMPVTQIPSLMERLLACEPKTEGFGARKKLAECMEQPLRRLSEISAKFREMIARVNKEVNIGKTLCEAVNKAKGVVEDVGEFVLEKACKEAARMSLPGLLSIPLRQVLPSWLASCPLKFAEGFLCSIPELLKSAVAIVKASPEVCGPIAAVPGATVVCGLVAMIKNAVPKIISTGKQLLGCFQRIGAVQFGIEVMKSAVPELCDFVGGLVFDMVVEILSAGAATGGIVAKYIGKVAHIVHKATESLKLGNIAIDKLVESGKKVAEVAEGIEAACGLGAGH
jgi:hypothetical protein